MRQKRTTCCPATQTDSKTRSGHDSYSPALWFSNPITKASCSPQSIGKLPSLRQIWSSEETTPAPSLQKHIQQPNCGDYRNRESRIWPHFLLRWGVKIMNRWMLKTYEKHFGSDTVHHVFSSEFLLGPPKFVEKKCYRCVVHLEPTKSNKGPNQVPAPLPKRWTLRSHLDWRQNATKWFRHLCLPR